MGGDRVKHLFFICFVSCFVSSFASLFFSTRAFAQIADPLNRTMMLHDQWRIQNSTDVSQTGKQISQADYSDATWTKATVPSTVLANLVGPHVGDGSPGDIYFAKNWLKLPGSGPYYQVGKNYSEVVTPPESPFGHAWWYRTTFHVSAQDLQRFAELNFKGITYGAEIWLNGAKLATPAETAGSYRQFKYDVTSLLKAGSNSLAVLVYPPLPTDLSPSWVDWNPTPQDKNMGLWREVFLRFHGAVSVERVFVSTDLPSLSIANLTIESEVSNLSARAVSGKLIARTLGFEIASPLTLAPHEVRRVQMQPSQFSQLKIKNPKLWWPWQMGAANLHHLKVRFEISGQISDEASQNYGIRRVESQLTPEGARLFSVNGRPIYIRGGGWASDLLLRFSNERQAKELDYVRALGLNTVRLEGRFETENFMELADKKGLLLMPGWVCCSAWQNGETWTAEHHKIGKASLVDQLYELRSHPSVFVFLYGSDEAPPADIEQLYLDAVKETNWPNPTVASASSRSTLVGQTGVKMTGPYAYTPPSYWYVEKETYGGAWGFNTETSPGVSMPPLESLKQFIPVDHLKIADDIWDFHMGENQFTTLDTHKAAITRRYGAIKDGNDLIRKSEIMDYDNHRAMFEAYAAHKYHSATGLIQWMLNSAWPSMMWHLYDFYLRPNAAFYGVKLANAPVHASLNPDSLVVSLTNSTYSGVQGLHVSAQVIDPNAKVLSTLDHTENLAVDSSKDVMALAAPANEPLYFVKLSVNDASGALIDTSIYWLSAKKEIYDWDATDFMITPVIQEGDLSGLEKLAPASVDVTSVAITGGRRVTIRNTGSTLAFFVHLDVQPEILPIDWSDNDISLMPGETRVLEVRAASSKKLSVHGSGWNVAPF
jgi:exo-1,4-beta-D-glucosaminidase